MPPEEKKSLLTRIVESKPPLYWWTLLNILMACLVVMSWLYFVPTFNYPEDPKHYERMIKLGRAPKLPAFIAEKAPEGIAIDPEKIHQIFSSDEFSKEDLAELNRTFLRNYIQGIKISKLNYYIRGKFKVIKTRGLKEGDLFRKGIIIKAVAQREVGNDNLLVPFLIEIEYLLPGVHVETQRHFPVGKLLDIYEVPNFCSILHVSRRTGNDGETVVNLTVVPIVVQPPLALEDGTEIQLTTPGRIYPGSPLPIF